MTQKKFQKGDVVRFTFIKNHPYRLSYIVWSDGSKEGKGLIINDPPADAAMFCEYAVIVTEPPDWNWGHNCDGILSGPNAGKGWCFYENALRPADSERKTVFPITNPKPPSITESDHAKLYRLFAQEKPDPSNPFPFCPNCLSSTTRPIRTIYCTECDWMKEP